MTLEEIVNIANILHTLKINHHIFFLTKEECEKQFDWLLSKKDSMPIYVKQPNNVYDSTLVISGITFCFIDPTTYFNSNKQQ